MENIDVSERIAKRAILPFNDIFIVVLIGRGPQRFCF
jgi:hypothetical protein